MTDDLFQRYREYRPTQFDSNIDIDRGDWYVMPVSQTRDSGPLDQSNFQQFLEGLGGESETVEVHRFGHWGPGWFEIIIVNPSDEKAVKAAEDMAESLQHYPVLNDEDFSRREWEEFEESWDSWACKDLRKTLVKEYGLSDRADDLLDDVPNDVLREIWQQEAGEVFRAESCGVVIDIDGYATDVFDRGTVAQLILKSKRGEWSKV
jgi:hypothetical protein